RGWRSIGGFRLRAHPTLRNPGRNPVGWGGRAKRRNPPKRGARRSVDKVNAEGRARGRPRLRSPARRQVAERGHLLRYAVDVGRRALGLLEERVELQFDRAAGAAEFR